MRIITTTYEDFVHNEITEHGHDYVEGMFLSGYEPTIVNGIWVWHRSNNRSNGVPIHNQSDTASCNLSSSTMGSRGYNISIRPLG
jgi:hypothetical protein